MIKATLFVENFYANNRLFDMTDKISNRDDCLFGFYLLREMLKKHNIDLSTQDINPSSKSQFIIYNEMPKFKYVSPNKNNYLLMIESVVIKPDNWNIENYKYFKKIFTWNDKFVDNKKYIKYCWPNKIPKNLDFSLNNKGKLCTIIVANKFTSHPLELYTERIKAIRWFEKNHPYDFDLYGMDWDKYYFKYPLSRLNRFDFLRKLLKPKYPSYKGRIESKKETYKKYKFAICYENAKDIPGYITEKIFDCFFAGCVPIYLGAPNVTDYIPPETFIDKRKFKTYEELYDYIKNMSNTEYQNYLTAIKNFVESDKIYPFSAECFAETIVKEILGED